MRPSSAKAKGRRLQNTVAENIRTLRGLEEEDVKPAIMGESGMDIHLSPKAQKTFPFAVECKNQERLNIWKALEQANTNSSGNQMPLVVFTRNGRGLYAVLEWQDLLFLLEQIAELEEIKDIHWNDGPDRESNPRSYQRIDHELLQ